jgi:thioredoxin 1
MDMKVLKFYADWCGPCKAISQVIKNAGDKITTPIEEVNIDENIMMSVEYGVRGVPTMVIVDDAGKEVKRQSGMMNETQLLDFLKV